MSGSGATGDGRTNASAAHPEGPADRARLLKALAAEEGFALAGICLPDPSAHGDFLARWLDRGHQGEMSYLARPESVARRRNVALTFPAVRSVLVVAHSYAGGADPEDRSRGIVARYARGRDYHRVLKKRLLRLHDRFESALGGDDVPARVYVDTGPVPERELAERAGLGWFGRNTMLINPRLGSWFFLGILLLGIDLEPDDPFERDHCGTCRACLDACPTDALLGRDDTGAPLMDARRCISYLTIELRGPIPRDLRSGIGNRVFGCDICQEVCPFNRRFGDGGGDPAYAARGPGEAPFGVEALREKTPGRSDAHPGTRAPGLIELMAMDEAAWDAFTRGTAIRRAGYAGFRRNVAVALGNWGAGEAVAPLAEALDDSDPLVRGHAAWALGRIDTEEARGALRGRLLAEREEWVRGELFAAGARS